MRLAVHIARLVVDALQFGLSQRRYSIVLVVVLGLVFLALTVTAQTAAPLFLYPFA